MGFLLLGPRHSEGRGPVILKKLTLSGPTVASMEVFQLVTLPALGGLPALHPPPPDAVRNSHTSEKWDNPNEAPPLPNTQTNDPKTRDRPASFYVSICPANTLHA